MQRSNRLQPNFSTIAEVGSGRSAQNKSQQRLTLLASWKSGEDRIRTCGRV